MILDDYTNGAKAIAERYGVADWLLVQCDDGHCRFDGYPLASASNVGRCVDELASYRAKTTVLTNNQHFPI